LFNFFLYNNEKYENFCFSLLFFFFALSPFEAKVFFFEKKKIFFLP